MLGEKLKALREAKSWSQAHLADAAQLNIRTVQRIEAGEAASHETLLSLAAALNIDMAQLEPGASARTAGLSRRRLGIAIACIAPAALFILVNLLRSAGGISEPFDVLAQAGGKVMSFRTFNLISPVIFVGGAAAAFALCLPTLVQIRATRIRSNAISINGIELRAQRHALAIVIAAVLSAAILVGYAALELLHTPLP